MLSAPSEPSTPRSASRPSARRSHLDAPGGSRGVRSGRAAGRVRGRLTALAALGAAGLALTACGSIADVEAAPHAADPDCAPVMIALPDSIGEADQRETNAQATAAFGDPSQAVVRCGVEPPGPSSEHCVSADGVDWLAVEEDGATWRLISYGREPAVEVLIDTEEISSSSVMLAMARPTKRIEADDRCPSVEQSLEDVEGSGGAAD
ncbi:hypothetical protein GCM10027060_02330 [Nesterenkonia halophila]|uniref:DUF3515 family protein n=1 Tax=Nesterenkonia halophila TaxID=302044 RepID=UPI001290BDCD|nr:DUF3515 family protein [Nesterenkonia halophila]